MNTLSYSNVSNDLWHYRKLSVSLIHWKMHVFIYRIVQIEITTKPYDRYALNQVIVATRLWRLNKICFWKLWYTKRSMEKLRKAWNTHIVVIRNNSDNGKSSAVVAWGYVLLGSWLALRIRMQRNQWYILRFSCQSKIVWNVLSMSLKPELILDSRMEETIVFCYFSLVSNNVS